jgi:hypothetical protein
MEISWNECFLLPTNLSLAFNETFHFVYKTVQVAGPSLIIAETYNMAKTRPILTLAEMEQKLGFKLEASTDPPDVTERWYSDLTPVCYGLRERMEIEYEECLRKERGTQDVKGDEPKVFPKPGETVVGIYTRSNNDSKF